MKTIRISPIIILSAISLTTFGQKEFLFDYNGKYEYTNPTSLILSASDFDSTLYAIIDETKYRLNYISKDTFEDNARNQVIFQRDKTGKVIRYTLKGRVFKLLTTEIEKQEW